jgi:hypothetical protein
MDDIASEFCHGCGISRGSVTVLPQATITALGKVDGRDLESKE